MLLQIDSNLVGRIPLCTYVINDGSLPGLEKTGSSGNESSPIIHPEFGCVSCKVISKLKIGNII
jgi:hypothetical protein